MSNQPWVIEEVLLDDGKECLFRNIQRLNDAELRRYVTVARRVMGETACYLKWAERSERHGTRDEKHVADALRLIALHSANLAWLESEANRRGLELPDWRNRKHVQQRFAWFKPQVRIQ